MIAVFNKEGRWLFWGESARGLADHLDHVDVPEDTPKDWVWDGTKDEGNPADPRLGVRCRRNVVYGDVELEMKHLDAVKLGCTIEDRLSAVEDYLIESAGDVASAAASALINMVAVSRAVDAKYKMRQEGYERSEEVTFVPAGNTSEYTNTTILSDLKDDNA